MIPRGRFRLFAESPAEYSTQAIDLVRESLVVDMLGLLTLDYQKLEVWRERPNGFPQAEFERLKSSGINVFHPAVGYVGGNIYDESLKDITGWNLFIASHPADFVRIERTSDLALAKSTGKLGIIIGQQNSEHFRTVDDVDRFYAMGQRVSQLTYRPNRLGGGSTDPRDSGLTEYGAQVVGRMNRLGMAIDVSHCADKTTLDAIEASAKPVLITHSNCRALMKTSARCKSDAAIRAMASKGGVMGITMVRYFTGVGASVTMEDVLNHIEHVATLAGIEHVGIGTDVDLEGRDHRPAPARRNDLDGVAYQQKIYDVAEGMLRRNYSRENIKLVLGGNFQRALGQIWAA